MRVWRVVFVYALLTAGAFVLLLPLWWMLTVSLSTPGDAQKATASADAVQWIPRDPQWDNYTEALRGMGAVRAAEKTLPSHVAAAAGEAEEPQHHPLWLALWTGNMDGAWSGFFDALANTIVITALCVTGTILASSLVGYGFARVRFRGNSVLFTVMLSTMMLPAQVTMIPVFILFRNLGWVDTILPLSVPAFLGNAFFIFLYRQFFLQIPQDLIDSARIDGAGWLGIWWRILLPMCRPVIAITAVFTFMGVWNDFLGPLLYLQSPEKGTLALALNSFRSQFRGVKNVHLLMAGSLVTMLPCVILFFTAQRQFIKGLNLGALKG